jgi:outer membrane immunogenic protein
MKKLLLGSVALVALVASPALAADLGPGPAPLPYYKAPAVAPLYDWTGFYLGGHANYTWAHSNGQTENTANGHLFEPGSSSSSAWHGGAQIGFDYMLPSRFVLGVVTDINSGVRHTNTFVNPSVTIQSEGETDVAGTFRGRAGYAFDTTLLYATAGGTWNVGHNTRTQIAGIVGNAGPGTVETASTSHIGWTVGGGVDYAFARNWDVFAEYRYVGSPDVTVTFPIAQRSTTSDTNVNVVEVGVNYRFNYGRY